MNSDIPGDNASGLHDNTERKVLLQKDYSKSANDEGKHLKNRNSVELTLNNNNLIIHQPKHQPI